MGMTIKITRLTLKIMERTMKVAGISLDLAGATTPRPGPGCGSEGGVPLAVDRLLMRAGWLSPNKGR